MAIQLPSLTIAAAAAASPSETDVPIPEEEEFYSSWSLFLVCMLLILSLWTSYYLQIKRIRAVHETLVSIFAGMFVGFIVRLAPGHLIREMLTFKHTLFFNLLLPPIILNSGYELKQENFFRNFGSILTFAFFGTFISAVGVGVLVYIYSFLGLEKLEVSLLECLIFGTTLSATDPVTILAIFNQYKVDPKLYTVIFGESLLNDAVSIVMYETLSQFHGTEIYLTSLFHGIGIFLLSFGTSMALGIFFGLAMSLVLKHSSLAMYPAIESCLVALSAYTCYFFSNGTGMSGIVSLLFCGITLKHYAYHTMSRRTQRTTKYIFATLAQLSENFIFIYLGLSLFTSPPSSEAVTSYVKPLFITITTVAVVFTRYAAVFPLSEAINFFHRHARGQRTDELPHSYQMMLFWAGLRGAVGVALAAGFQGENAQTLRTTVLIVVVVTVLMFGGTTARMLEVLGIRTGVEDEAASDSEDEGGMLSGARNWSLGGSRRNSFSNGRWGMGGYVDDDMSLHTPRTPGGRTRSYFASQQQGPGRRDSRDAAAARIGAHYGRQQQNGGGGSVGGGPSSWNHQHQAGFTLGPGAPAGLTSGPGSPIQSGSAFSAASSESYDSDGGEVLPLASGSNGRRASGEDRSSVANGGRASEERTPEDGKWFQQIDERYLLPLFSNATASRTFHARRARRSQIFGQGDAGASSLGPNGEEGDEEDEGAEVELGVPSRMSMGLGMAIGGNGRDGQEDDLEDGMMMPIPHGGVPGAENRMERGLPSPNLRSNTDFGASKSP